jgi:hypothetical protein
MSEKEKEGAGSGNTHYHIEGGTFHVYMPSPGAPQSANPNFGPAPAAMAGPPPPFRYLPAGGQPAIPPPAPEPPGYITLPKGFPPRMLAASSHPPDGSQQGSTSLQHLIPAAPGSPGPSSAGAGQVAAQANVWDKYYYREYQYAPAAPVVVPPPGLVPIVGPPPPPPTAESAQPLPYHTCAECGRTRSSRYHRDNPIIPGRPPIQGVCRRCQKKSEEAVPSETHYIKKITHITSCEAPQPCVPLEDEVYVRVIRDDEDRRGRRPTRGRSVSSDEVENVTRVHSSSRHRSLHRVPSRVRVGVRVLKEHSPSPPPAPKYTYVEYDRSPSPRRTVTRYTRVVHRVESESPPRQRRYESPPPRARYRYESPPGHRSRERYSATAAERIAALPSPFGYRVVQGGENHPYGRGDRNCTPPGHEPASERREYDGRARGFESPFRPRHVSSPFGFGSPTPGPRGGDESMGGPPQPTTAWVPVRPREVRLPVSGNEMARANPQKGFGSEHTPSTRIRFGRWDHE